MPTNLDIRVGRPWGGLGGAYARGEERALRWFAGDWRDPEVWRERARVVDGSFHRDARRAAVAALRAPTPEVAAALARLADGEHGFLVTTGQQPGLFTGPLYTIHKALTAVALARWLEPIVEAPVTPVFWIASEDHDWAEVDHAALIGTDNALHHLRLSPVPRAGELPLHRLPLGADLASTVAEISQLLPDTEFTKPCLDLIRDVWKPGVTLPEGVRATLEAFLGRLGMAFVDAGDPALKAASTPVLEAAARGAETHERDLARRIADLTAEGWPVQVPVLEGGVNLFLETAAGRERLYRKDGGFATKGGTTLSLDDLARRLRDDPSTISPNVLLRPVVEAAVLPTLGYVAGPSETAYHAELAPLFASHGVAQTLVVPRLSATLVEKKVGKVLDKLGIDLGTLARPLHEIAGDLARSDLPEGVTRALAGVRATLDREGAALRDAAVGVDPTLKAPMERARTLALDAFADAEKKVVQALKRDGEIRLQQVEKARLHLFPDGEPQERVINAFYYLARYGPELLDELVERFLESLRAEQAAGARG